MSHPLLARLASGDPDERRSACRDAAEDPSGVLLVAALERALGDGTPSVAVAAADALAAIGARAGGVEETLARALRSDRPNARWAAAFAAARLSPPVPRLLPPLVEALDCSAGEIRWRAARLLTQCAPVLPEIEPLLRGLAAGDARARVRRMALHCLRELAPHTAETLRTLLAASSDADTEVRRAGLAGLAAVHEPPPSVGERLLAVYSADPDTASRCLAATALATLAARDRAHVPADTEAVLERVADEAEAPALRSAARRAMQVFLPRDMEEPPAS